MFPISQIQGRRELQKSGGSECPICPQFSENSLFIAFLCDNFLDFPKSGGSADPSDPLVTTPLYSNNQKWPHISTETVIFVKDCIYVRIILVS